MKFEEAKKHVDGVPFISKEQARALYDFVLRQRPQECLELGFAHGTSVCYLAAALDEIGAGHVTAVDLVSGQEWQDPSIEQLLDRCGLNRYVTVVREKLSYTWFLKRKIEEQTADHACTPMYDFCYIDGPKNWTVDGAAFFMVDKLLKENGYLLFDDMDWTYGSCAEWSARKLEETGILVSQMDKDESNQPHVAAIFELLVMQHPNYSNFEIVDKDWGWAQKTKSQETKLTIRETAPFSTALKRQAKKFIGRYTGWRCPPSNRTLLHYG